MIRKFTPKDTEKIMQIWLNGNIDAHDFVPKEYWESNTPAVRKQLLQADVSVYEVNGVVQGFVGMQEDYLAGIFVNRTCRSMGIGKALLNNIKERYPYFTLHVYQKNGRAVAFYLREGLVIVSRSLEGDTGNLEYTMAWEQKEAACHNMWN